MNSQGKVIVVIVVVDLLAALSGMNLGPHFIIYFFQGCSNQLSLMLGRAWRNQLLELHGERGGRPELE